MSDSTSHNSTRRSHPDDTASARPVAHELELRQIVIGCPRSVRISDTIAKQIAELVPKVPPEKVAALAMEAREHRNQPLVSLLLVREMCRHQRHRASVAETLARVVQQPEELIQFVALYWSDGRVPLSAQAKKGIAAAFVKFDEQQLASCKPKGPIKLRDILFLSHAKPRDEAQAAVWKRLVWRRLRAPTKTSKPLL